MQAIDRLARHRGLYDDEKMALTVNQTMASMAIGTDLSVLTDEELAELERLTVKATAAGNNRALGARVRIIEHIEKIAAQASESDEK